VVALATGWEAVSRLIVPHSIEISEALAVSVLGLLVNIVSLLLLSGGIGRHGHGHGHSHARGHAHGSPHGHSHGTSHGDAHGHDAAHAHGHDAGHGHSHDESHRHGTAAAAAPAKRSWRQLLGAGGDQNLRGAALHVAADALTSVLAIGALLAALLLGWTWLDPAVGLVGMAMIGIWAWGLTRDTGRVLLDADIDPAEMQTLRGLLEADGDTKVQDLHLWRIGPDHLAAIVSLVSHKPMPPEHYKRLLGERPELGHVTIEVRLCEGDHAGECPEGIVGTG
jgi:cation diffusion facilitator family transporter